MEKVIIIGDIHGDSSWNDVLEKEKDFNKIIFLGDYFDSLDPNISIPFQAYNLKEILKLDEIYPDKEIIRLIGNHDHQYFPEIIETCSGYNFKTKLLVQDLLDKNRHKFKMCYKLNDYIFTHAGVGMLFMEDNFGEDFDVEEVDELLNDLWKYKPGKFSFTGWDPYGDNKIQTPIWIRPPSLMRGNKKSKLEKRYIQVIGHTNDFISLNPRYIGLDLLNYKNKYGVLENGEITIKELYKFD